MYTKCQTTVKLRDNGSLPKDKPVNFMFFFLFSLPALVFQGWSDNSISDRE